MSGKQDTPFRAGDTSCDSSRVAPAVDSALGAAPTADSERHALLDALRGLALFGVLFVNMIWFSTGGGAVPSAMAEALPTAPIDRWVDRFMQVFVFAKANTIFTFLFGVSFALQMQRLEQRGAAARSIYLRRLVGLLFIGLLHLFGAWKGEVLHVYAIAGIALLLVSRWRTSTLIVVGLLLALIVERLLSQGERWMQWFGVNPTAVMFGDRGSSAEMQAQRLATFQTGSYGDVLWAQWNMMLQSGYFGLGLATWIVYALGRFMLGVAAARGGYLFEPERHVHALRAAVLIGLPLGLICTVSAWLAQALERIGWVALGPDWRMLSSVLTPLGTMLMAVAYVACVALAWGYAPLRRLLIIAAPAGQMALTTYLLQTVFNSLVFFGFGLGFVGRMGAAGCLLLSLAFFAVQVAVSRFWLHHFRFGPFEWLWRWWTYGVRPAWRRGSAVRP